MLISSLIKDECANEYCRALGQDIEKVPEALIVAEEKQEKMVVGCFSVEVQDTDTFTLPDMEDVVQYYIDCDIFDSNTIVVPAKAALI